MYTMSVCLQLWGCWIQVMVSVSGIVIDQVTRGYWLFWWLNQSSPSVSLTLILSLSYTHTHVTLGWNPCIIVSVGWSICRKKNCIVWEQTSMQKTEKRRSKEKKGTLLWPRQWVCDCVSERLFIVSSDYQMPNCSPEDLMTGEQRTMASGRNGSNVWRTKIKWYKWSLAPTESPRQQQQHKDVWASLLSWPARSLFTLPFCYET